jgi:hypothetical protein
MVPKRAAMLPKANLKSFTTLAGSLIRELAGPSWTAARRRTPTTTP